ncbi:MAG TPA: multidrug efflux RND transporter permease subunit [Phycisphaerales bacterium]|nr:multidrug efflux RND transporter permease subunit [Phycisphaerales bacterium]
MISKFFIDRPVFASVLSIVIVLAGLVAIRTLPIGRFPDIVPPGVQVTARYQGASAETVAQSVAAPIEQQLSGARNLIYFQSQSANDGSMTLTSSFEIGTNQDLAAVDVQNRLAIAQPRLPQDVVRSGLPVTKTSTNIVCVAFITSPNRQYDDIFLANYATINVVDQLKRIPGVGDATVFGAKDYAMRIWVNPERLEQRGLTVSDLAASIREQNAIFAAGRIGQRPHGGEVELTVPVLTRGRLSDASEYENIILRAGEDGTILRLKDVARVELGSQSYDNIGRMDGQPAAPILVNLQSGGNALQVYEDVQRTMESLKKGFPPGVDYAIPYETVSFVRVSIEEVIATLLEAIGLVLLVVFVFLQNWRATLIPLLAVPVSIVGAFAGMYLLGFSINTLTLFGLVLAIGIVVDDAIVVVENVERIMEEEGLPVREATIKAMEEVTGPIIAIVLVLSAVFVPVAFLGGLTGELYRQFAVTIAVSVTISGFVALTLSPALCRLLLRSPHEPKGVVQRGLDLVFFRWFNRAFALVTRGYTSGVRGLIRVAIIPIVLFVAIALATGGLFRKIPSGFIPDEDQGYIITAIFLPDGASLDRTDKAVRDVEAFYLAKEQSDIVDHTVALIGLDLFAGRVNTTSAAIVFTRLKAWDQRLAPGLSAKDLIARTFRAFGARPDAVVIAVNPPSIQGLGQRAGFEMQFEARAGQDVRDLVAAANRFIAEAAKRPELTGMSAAVRVTQPQLFVDLDRDRAKTAGVPVDQVFDALQAYLGALYVNDFDKFGRVWRVQLQAEPEFRASPDSLGQIYVRNSKGEMVPVSGLVTTNFQVGPNLVSHFNGYPSVQITGAPGPGLSTGQSISAVEEVFRGMNLAGEGYTYEWSGASFQEVRAGNAAPLVIVFGLVVVFLVLAAQYEKWSLPIAVMLAVPLGAFGALVAVYLKGTTRDIYFQVGLLTLVGLAAKNAILIIEFCVVLREQGKGVVEAAVQAARQRFRPILMTSLAFILGVLPLVLAKGAGAAGRQSIGTGVMGGMIAATVLAVFLVPLFYVVIQRGAEWVGGHTKGALVRGGASEGPHSGADTGKPV